MGDVKQREMVEGKTALDNFTRAMKTIFRVSKSEVEKAERRSAGRKKRGRSARDGG
jgi:hypothetical protein